MSTKELIEVAKDKSTFNAIIYSLNLLSKNKTAREQSTYNRIIAGIKEQRLLSEALATELYHLTK